MTKATGKSGWTLVWMGIIGVVFFWLTDPRFGWVQVWEPAANPIDAANEALWGTLVGVIGSLIVLCVGVWLLKRRAA